MSTFTNLDLLRGVVAMMDVRGYDTSHFAAIWSKEYTPELFESTIPQYFRMNPTPIQAQLIAAKYTSLRSLMSHIFVHKANPTNRLLVYFADIGTTKQVPITEAQMFGLLLEKQQCIFGMIVTHTKLSPPAAVRIVELEAPGIYFLQRWLDEEVLINPLESEWGSETTILGPEETKALLVSDKDDEKTSLGKLHPNQMPKIVLDDPVAKYLGLLLGQVLQIRRTAILPEMLCDEEISYQIAVRRPPEKSKSSKAPSKGVQTVAV